MLGLAIQNIMQAQYIAGVLQLIIALGFLALLIRNILAVRQQKQVCNTELCTGTNWISNLFKKKEK
jgi:hypothetical protein